MRSGIWLALAGFLFGVWFASLWPWGYAVAGLFLLIALALLVLRQRLGLVALVFIFAALGSTRMEWRGVPGALPLADVAGAVVISEAVVVAEPKPSQTTTQLVVETEAGERYLLLAPLYPAYRYGDRLRFSGQLTRPENFITSSGREFAYEDYLARQDIYYQVFQPEITLLGRGEGSVWRRALAAVKGKFLAGIESVLPEPQAGLLAGLLLGSRASLDRAVLEDFRRVGLTHMIVLSGYNLTIVAEAVRAVFRFLPLFPNLGAAALSIILFALMAGGGGAVWRAALMAVFALLARATGRVYDVARALALTVVALVLWDPRYLVFDLGFQLSILATLGLLFLSSLIKNWFGRVPERFGLREILVSTVAAQIAVLPWILYQTGELSLAAFPANPLVLIVVPAIMLFGFAAGLLSLISSSLAFLPGSLAYLLLSYQLALVNLFARLPLASLSVRHFPLLLVVLVYALLAYWYYQKNFRAQTLR